ncbi:hypothetical protein B0T11DRAFT_301519 [Plectosphaerella cucumerina]|uniref:Uncharacterized protein n=1 Tax=Plectosphaerella cucumerina TaxID=40658 RepID=A0A8K0TFK2_9PEZI|nr:hypothetical protein B0T11DRAFT_301519 [Plectosphaerella cucumerina]
MVSRKARALAADSLSVILDRPVSSGARAKAGLAVNGGVSTSAPGAGRGLTSALLAVPGEDYIIDLAGGIGFTCIKPDISAQEPAMHTSSRLLPGYARRVRVCIDNNSYFFAGATDPDNNCQKEDTGGSCDGFQVLPGFDELDGINWGRIKPEDLVEGSNGVEAIDRVNKNFLSSIQDVNLRAPGMKIASSEAAVQTTTTKSSLGIEGLNPRSRARRKVELVLMACVVRLDDVSSELQVMQEYSHEVSNVFSFSQDASHSTLIDRRQMIVFVVAMRIRSCSEDENP